MADADPPPVNTRELPSAQAQPQVPPQAQPQLPSHAKAPATSRAIPNGRMALLFTVMLVTAAGNTAMQSVMPSIGTALQVEDFWISLAYSWSALLWVTCAPIWARRSDKRGRKAMMALGLIGFIASMGLCGLALWAGLSGYMTALATLITFAAARSLYGLFGSAAPPAVQAYVAARTPRSERTNALSLIASSFGLGTVIGPVLAPLLVFPYLGIGLTGPFISFALIGLVALVLLRLRLPNDEPQFAARGQTVAYSGGSDGSTDPDENYDDEDEGAATAPSREGQRLGWFDPRLRAWVLAGLVGGHAQAMIMGIAGFLVLDRLNLRSQPEEGAALVSLVFVFGALATLLAQWGLIPRFRIGPRAATLSGMCVAALGTGVLGIADDVYSLSLGFAIASLGFGLFRPGTTAGTSLAVSRAEQGQASGIVASVAGASFIYAPAVGVLLYNANAPLAFALIAALCLSVVLVGLRGLALDSVLTQDR